MRTGVTNPEIFENHEIRVYHVDSISLSNGEVTSSFDIGDVKDVEDQCAKPDGIHPEFIHANAIDYGRCESGAGSTNYEIHYMGPYTMVVKRIDNKNYGITVFLEFEYDQKNTAPIKINRPIKMEMFLVLFFLFNSASCSC